MLNLHSSQRLFWDGRKGSLDELVIEPLTNPLEHGFRSDSELEAALQADIELNLELANYWAVTPEHIRAAHVTQPLAAYVGSLASLPSAIDRYLGGDSTAISAAAERGYRLFSGRAKCAACHLVSGDRPDFTDKSFHLASGALSQHADLSAVVRRVLQDRQNGSPTGHLLGDAQVSTLGRFVVTLDPADIGTFRTPGLRNVAITAPYMHDGSVATLEEAVERELYDREGYAGRAIALSVDEKADLVEFLRSLTDENYVQGGAK